MLEDILSDRFVLRDGFRDLELRKDDGEQPEVTQHSKRDRRLRGGEDLHHLLLDALPRKRLGERRGFADRVGGPRIDREAEQRREPHGTQHPKGVLLEALARLTRASRSRCPPNGSTSSPGLPSVGGRQAIAFIVKSRRDRSS